MSYRSMLLLCLVASSLLGCSLLEEEEKLPPGRCVLSGECPEGETCRNTYCEDIYFPRKDIKPY